jgi:serine/threonine-protein phosphatase 2A regulatory subunit B'
MVYNALKLFMGTSLLPKDILIEAEVNPQLFDECSHEYTQQQSALQEKQAFRKQRWDRLEALAAARKTHPQQPAPPASAPPAVPRDEGDPLENQRRMEALRLQDDTHRTTVPVSASGLLNEADRPE